MTQRLNRSCYYPTQRKSQPSGPTDTTETPSSPISSPDYSPWHLTAVLSSAAVTCIACDREHTPDKCCCGHSCKKVHSCWTVGKVLLYCANTVCNFSSSILLASSTFFRSYDFETEWWKHTTEQTGQNVRRCSGLCDSPYQSLFGTPPSGEASLEALSLHASTISKHFPVLSTLLRCPSTNLEEANVFLYHGENTRVRSSFCKIILDTDSGDVICSDCDVLSKNASFGKRLKRKAAALDQTVQQLACGDNTEKTVTKRR